MVGLLMICLLVLVLTFHFEFDSIKKIINDKFEDLQLEASSRSIDYVIPSIDDDYGL